VTRGPKPVQRLSWSARCVDAHVVLDLDRKARGSTSASTLSRGRQWAAGPTDLLGGGNAEALQDRGGLLPGSLGGELVAAGSVGAANAFKGASLPQRQAKLTKRAQRLLIVVQRVIDAAPLH
jgi:hypothetical protein